MKATSYPLVDFFNVFKNACKGKTESQTFDDFLTLCLSFFTKKQNTEFTQYQEDFSRIMYDYKQRGTFHDLLQLPPLLFAMLEIKETLPDIMGDFYMNIIAGEDEKRFLAPYHLCLKMTEVFSYEAIGYVCVLDTSVKSGRMLIAFARNSCERHRYYGIETNPILAKLAAVNMFIHGLSGEVICAEGSDPENFRSGYRVSIVPRGILKIEEKEKSQLWLMYRDVFGKMRKENPQKRLLFF